MHRNPPTTGGPPRTPFSGLDPVLAGPAAVESEAQIIEAADAVAAAGGSVLRAGTAIAGSSPYEYRGVGADAVWISNHGGRQLDTAPATIDTLADIVAAVSGQAEVILDGGIRRGTDIVKALALGARAVAVGRPYLYGLGAAGEAGVTRALDILTSALRRDMALTGVTRLDALTPDFVRKPR